MVISKTQKLADEYIGAERKLQKHLATLKNGTEMCDCEEPKQIEVIYAEDGCRPLVTLYCLECGGAITP